METMKIKIIKATPEKWYFKLVGKVRHAKSIANFFPQKCFVLRNYRTILRTVDFNDAEIL